MRARRLAGRGNDEGDSGSNAGSSDGAGRLTPATGATGSLPLPGEEFFLSIVGLYGQVPAWREGRGSSEDLGWWVGRVERMALDSSKIYGKHNLQGDKVMTFTLCRMCECVVGVVV